MEHVEELLIELAAEWQIDIYVRLGDSQEHRPRTPEASSGLAPNEVERFTTSAVVDELRREARTGGAPVVRNDLAHHATQGKPSEAVSIGIDSIFVVPITSDSDEPMDLVFASRSLPEIDPATQARLLQLSQVILSYSIERDHSSRQLRNLVIRLTEAEASERARIALLLHDDLQQTLAGVKVHLDMARRRTSADEYVAGRLGTAASLLEEGIERSRNLSHELRPPMLRHRGVVDAIRSLAGQTERTHGLRVAVEAPSTPIPLSEFSKFVVYRAVQELLFNIVKHAGVAEAHIEVRLSDEGVKVIVQDSGRGFDIDGAIQLDSPAGLGLISLRERIEAIGGALLMESIPGAGSTFTIFMPPQAMRAPGVKVGRLAVTSTLDAPDRSISVVLVDDHAVIRQGIALLLSEEPDLEVVGEADSGQRAIQLVKHMRPDVVVMDLSMPGMPGDEATRTILEQTPGTRVIGLSMHSEREAKDRMLSAGASAYLPKAGPSADLIAAIRDSIA